MLLSSIALLWNPSSKLELISLLKVQLLSFCLATFCIVIYILYGSQTAHSLLKIPLLCYDYSTTCAIKAQDDAAKRIQQADVILIDEISMFSDYIFDSIDRCMQQLMSILYIQFNTLPN